MSKRHALQLAAGLVLAAGCQASPPQTPPASEVPRISAPPAPEIPFRMEPLPIQLAPSGNPGSVPVATASAVEPPIPHFPAAPAFPGDTSNSWRQPWQGAVNAPEMVPLDGTYYVTDGTLEEVPVEGGTWQAAPAAPPGSWRHVTSDGQVLYLGGADGTVRVFDPAATRSAMLGSLPCPVSGMLVASGDLYVGTDGAGTYQIALGGGPPLALSGGPPHVRQLGWGNDGLYALGNGIWHRSDGVWSEVGGSADATAMKVLDRHVYAGTPDGTVLAGHATLVPMVKVASAAITVLEADHWDLYAGVGNIMYMVDFGGDWWAPCGSPLPGPQTFIWIPDLAAHLVGTPEGVYMMPR